MASCGSACGLPKPITVLPLTQRSPWPCASQGMSSAAGGDLAMVWSRKLRVPVLRVFLVGVRGQEEADVIRASHPMRCNRAREHSSSLRHSVMSVDQAEVRWCDLNQENRSRQVGRLNGGVIQPFAAPVIRDLGQLHDLGREAFQVGRDERNEARDVELEDAVGVELVARLGCAGLKPRIASKGDGLACWSGSGTPFPRVYPRLSPTTRKKWNQNWNQLLFWTWNQWRSREKKSK